MVAEIRRETARRQEEMPIFCENSPNFWAKVVTTLGARIDDLNHYASMDETCERNTQFRRLVTSFCCSTCESSQPIFICKGRCKGSYYITFGCSTVTLWFNGEPIALTTFLMDNRFALECKSLLKSIVAPLVVTVDSGEKQ